MNYVINKEQYLKLKKGWKEQQSHSASEMIAYNILRGFDPKRGFTPKTNPIKLANGAEEWQAFGQARAILQYELKWSKEKKCFERWSLESSEELTNKILEALK